MTFHARALTLLTLAALTGGCSLFSSFGKLNEADLQFRNEGVRMNIRTVALSLTMYARDHKALYPMKNNWIGELQRSYYLPGKRLPPNPWVLMDENTQANSPGLGLIPPMTDENFDGPPIGTVLGKGTRPDSAIYAVTTYGAILYDVTPNRRACALYGVGQKDDDAIIIDSHFRGRP